MISILFLEVLNMEKVIVLKSDFNNQCVHFLLQLTTSANEWKRQTAIQQKGILNVKKERKHKQYVQGGDDLCLLFFKWKEQQRVFPATEGHATIYTFSLFSLLQLLCFALSRLRSMSACSTVVTGGGVTRAGGAESMLGAWQRPSAGSWGGVEVVELTPQIILDWAADLGQPQQRWVEELEEEEWPQ